MSLREGLREAAALAARAKPALKRGAALALISLATVFAAAQESFGFGDESLASDQAAVSASAGAALGARVGGTIEFGTRLFLDTTKSALDAPLAGLATGSLGFEAKGSAVDGVFKLKITEKALRENPASLVDEASLRLYAGPLTLEGGLLKVSWGKADSQGPLDILNPLDLSDLSVTDTMERKIARPMLRASLALGDLSKLELVGLAGFEGNRIAFEGPWMPKAIANLKTSAYDGFYWGANRSANGGKGEGLYASYFASAWSTAYTSSYVAGYSSLYQSTYTSTYTSAYTQALMAGKTAGEAADAAAAQADGAATGAVMLSASTAANAACAANASSIAAQAKADSQSRVENLMAYPDTSKLDWSQGGARFTTSLGPVDMGFQYFFGFLPTPAVSSDPAALAANGYRASITYNRYHQAGLDLATVLAGFNIRAEAAANLTKDMDGKDPAVYNPALAWSLGFDRDLFAGINLNLQGTGSYRLFEEGIGSSSYDVEKGTDRTRTRITGLLSRKFLKDRLELKLAGVYGVEDVDFLVSPGLVYAIGDANVELTAGIFGGDAAGELGQFANSSYAKLTLSYKF